MILLTEYQLIFLPATILKAGPIRKNNGSNGFRQQTYSGRSLCQHLDLLTLFTNQTYYLFHVGISLGCGRIGQMG